MRKLSVLAWAFVLACSEAPIESPAPSSAPPSEPPEDTATTEPSEVASCENPRMGSAPEDGAVGVYYRTPIWIELTRPDPTAVLTLQVEGGTAAVGTSAVDGTLVTFVGDPLLPSTDYRLTLEHACGTDVLLFATSEVGSPLEVDVVGRTFALDPGQGDWIEPSGAGEALGVLLAPFRILLGVTAIPSPAAIDLIVGVGVDGEQNPCAPTLDLIGSDWVDPYFSIEADHLDLENEDFALRIDDFALTGAIAPDGSGVQGATLTGTADTRELGAELGLGTEPGAVCDLLAAFGASCTSCDDGVIACIDVVVENVDGMASPVPIVGISPEESATCE